jgi:transketolase
MVNVDKKKVKELEEKVIQLRKDMYRTTSKIGYSHLGGGNSMADVAVALYYDFLNFDPKNPNAPDRDRFVLSKGHCGHVLYNIFVDKGMYTKEELWSEYNQPGGRFGMHPNYHYIDGIEASTGSLGHGLSIALGMAIAARNNKKNHRVMCMAGDGEMNEGSMWEALMAAGNFGMGNLALIIDYNKCTGSGPIKDVMDIAPLEDKLRAFKWDVLSMDGHNMQDIIETLHKLPPVDVTKKSKPCVIISHTIKGKTMLGGLEGTASSHIGFVKDEETYNQLCASVDATRKED